MPQVANRGEEENTTVTARLSGKQCRIGFQPVTKLNPAASLE
jgi:hypothetical protein